MTVSLGFVKRKKCLKEGKKMTVSFRTSSSRIRPKPHVLPGPSFTYCHILFAFFVFFPLFKWTFVICLRLTGLWFFSCHILNLSSVLSTLFIWVCLVEAGRLGRSFKTSAYMLLSLCACFPLGVIMAEVLGRTCRKLASLFPSQARSIWRAWQSCCVYTIPD